ncbi:MAG: M43 family zinc metalloprotease [Chitinophagaceae bacterium]
MVQTLPYLWRPYNCKSTKLFIMIRKALLTLGVMAFAVSSFAQGSNKCATDEFHREQLARHPEIAIQKAKLDLEIRNSLRGISNLPNAKGTRSIDSTCWAQDTIQYHVPVVFHVISDFMGSNPTAITDDQIYGAIDQMNYFYNMATPPAGIINPFKQYVGNARFTFHLANKDPDNKPTRGIVRVNSYLANGGDEAAKLNPWAPDEYLNIYLENFVGKAQPGGTILAYATFPTDYLSNPYSQGVISRTDQGFSNLGKIFTLSHEVGHFFYLYHPWNSNNLGAGDPAKICGDDEVDDTPPTIGHTSCSNADLYDTLCASGYMKSYDAFDYYKRTCLQTDTGGIIDYPDTTNTQNIMDYSFCSTVMFTKGQVARMRAAARSSIGMRNNLISLTNLIRTGIMDSAGNELPRPEIIPTAWFSVNRPFVCADGSTSVQFTDRSYNATTTVAWTFGGGASTPDATSKTVNNNFNKPGWVDVTQIATGPKGSDTLTRSDMVYAASDTAIDPTGYVQNFNPGTDVDQYPIFNYYGTDFKWGLVNNAGYFDNTSLKFANFDDRNAFDPTTTTRTPSGLYADFYTRGFDLSKFGTVCNVSFFSASATRTTQPSQMNDSLVVSASYDCGVTWTKQGAISKGNLANNGYVTTPFTPIYNQWQEQSIPVDPFTGRPAGANSRVFFRFRYYVGSNLPVSSNISLGTGNNFYIDRISISSAPLGVKNGVITNLGMNVMPNPTNGAATVSIVGGDNSDAMMIVTDVTGKVVYNTTIVRKATNTKIEIPAAVISVKGMYLVKIITNGATDTKKLVVY